MQLMMILDHCAKCNQPILPGEPAMQTASVHIIGRRAVSSPVKSYHLKNHCPRTQEPLPTEGPRRAKKNAKRKP